VQDIALTVCALVVICYVFAQPLGLFYALWKSGTRRRSGGAGPYRGAPEDLVQTLSRENRELRKELDRIKGQVELKDRLIEELWLKSFGQVHPDVRKRQEEQTRQREGLTKARFAGFLSLAAASGMVVGALGMIPAHTAPESYGRATMPTMLQVQITSGGEVPILRSYESGSFLLCKDLAVLHVPTHDEPRLLWGIEPYMKPDEFDLAFWLSYHKMHENIPVLVALY
jgi:hypothetical protein